MSSVFWEHPAPPLDEALVLRAAEAALTLGGRPGAELSIVFVSAEVLTKMHARHLDDTSPTDVITFDLGDDGDGPVGELYISVDCAIEVAAERKLTVERELVLYVVHGVLHLCGFDDHGEVERARMREAERAVLDELGFPQDRVPHDRG